MWCVHTLILPDKRLRFYPLEAFSTQVRRCPPVGYRGGRLHIVIMAAFPLAFTMKSPESDFLECLWLLFSLRPSARA